MKLIFVPIAVVGVGFSTACQQFSEAFAIELDVAPKFIQWRLESGDLHCPVGR